MSYRETSVAKAERTGFSEEVTLELRLNGHLHAPCPCTSPFLLIKHRSCALIICLPETDAVLALCWLNVLLPLRRPSVPTASVQGGKSRRNVAASLLLRASYNLAKFTESPVNTSSRTNPQNLEKTSQKCVEVNRSPSQRLILFKTLTKNSPHLLEIIVIFQSLYKILCKETKLFSQADRYSKLLALNKHSNTSVKSNKFKLNEISICLQCISLWHFLYCHGALIKFFKMQRKCL